MQGVKVLSIFGNTGDGKSHTLNHILFGGDTVFYTSKSPSSCTVGVWAAFDSGLGLVALDTEGLLGAAANQNQRMRLLLKVLAVSDVVVYRTRAERLHNDMFQFLSSASGAYLKHFTPELRALSSRCGMDVPLSSLGPAVIVFQETTHTQLLGHGMYRRGPVTNMQSYVSINALHNNLLMSGVRQHIVEWLDYAVMLFQTHLPKVIAPWE